ncbi:MAG: hypothetical protein M3N08_08520, partial [Pseudomonadota bacterium]|nr:hypothetical protein [Pseudomonadota bacterium]
HNAEQTLIRHYHKLYGGDGTERLDKLRTRLANEYGQKVADMSAPTFCAQRRDRVVQMYQSNGPSLTAQISYMTQTERPYERACPEAATVKKKAK